MFTGIIRHVGSIASTAKEGSQAVVLTIKTPLAGQLREGDSVAVNGTCLTVLAATKKDWQARLMAETLQKTNLGNLKKGSVVNLEQPLRLNDTLDGHFVQGHVDGVGVVIGSKPVGDDRVFTIKPPSFLLPFFIPKGSVSLDGVSLTVVEVLQNSFTVSLMPYTLEQTIFSEVKTGYKINIEVDMIGKYVQRFTNFRHRR